MNFSITNLVYSLNCVEIMVHLQPTGHLLKLKCNYKPLLNDSSLSFKCVFPIYGLKSKITSVMVFFILQQQREQ